MDGNVLVSHFGRIGARVRVVPAVNGDLRLDIRADAEGQYFDVRAPRGGDARVIDIDRQLRHLLLLGVKHEAGGQKSRYLCGHDEREWFVAAVPGNGVSRVRQAMEALKPSVVRVEQERMGVSRSDRVRRKTAAYIRQGEWFFLPRPDLKVPDSLVLRNEPLSRGRGKPHWAEFLYRTGGENVMVSQSHPRGLTIPEYRELIRVKPRAANWNWRPMRRNPTAFVKGRIRHPDHATVRLDDWHLVAMNTEPQAPWSTNVIFID